jgi:hypothetical protein
LNKDVLQAQKDYSKVKNTLIAALRPHAKELETLYPLLSVPLQAKRRKHLFLNALWKDPERCQKASALILSVLTCDSRGKLIPNPAAKSLLGIQ